MKVTTVGLDIAKQVFQVHAADWEGRAVLRKRLQRAQVAEFFANLSPCVVGLEACCGSHYWARVLGRFGHTVKLIAPQFVKPYVKSNKNDANDAEAICEAVSRPQMRFVPAKSIEQQDIQSLHRVRSRFVSSRTALASQLRGLLSEYGIVLPTQIGQLRRGLPLILEDAANELTNFSRRLFSSLYQELVHLDDKIEALDEQVKALYRASEPCQRIAAVEGIGPLIATALVAAVTDGKNFKNGRQFAAWLGLVPRQHSTGGKARLFGISKRGDPYLRTLLIHGARSVVYRSSRKTDPRNRWIADKQRRLGTSKACVALANKNARIVWSLLARGQSYRRAA
jgi:transposase